jgi:phosphoribosyl 1,2-cyclic phosphodiesterase
MFDENVYPIDLTFWGVRGSLPTSPDPSEFEIKLKNILKDCQRQKLDDAAKIDQYIAQLPVEMKRFVGSNTACIYINIEGKHIILDAGSGIRPLGEMLMTREFGDGHGEAHIFLTHTHWDHIMGFPFFAPAYKSGNNITIYGVHNGLEQRISNQQEDEYYPVSLSAMGAVIDFFQLRKEEAFDLDGIWITNKMLNHPGGSFGYRIDYQHKSIVYATDSEYKYIDKDRYGAYIEFFRGADVLIFDAQYTIEESIEKENWGHSTSLQGVDFAAQANVKHLLFFHHDPSYSDQKLEGILRDAIRYRDEHYGKKDIRLSIAREGLNLKI